MDGRIQVPIYSWLKKNHRIDFVDTITEPGVDRLFNDIVSIKSIKTKVLISVNKHGSKTILVSGHHDCAGNPVSKKQHQTQIKNAVSVIESWNLPVSVIGAWVNENWQVEVMPR
jgi:hypothetical protein